MLSTYLYQKINDQMRLIYITACKPKQKIRLNPIDPQDLNVDLQLVNKWSPNNKQLYQMVIQNGMAQFICNRQFLNQFYQKLNFMYANLSQIDSGATLLSNLKVLNLFHNKIKTIENIPATCKQLYLDFNIIQNCESKFMPELELLSLSHNFINDFTFQTITTQTPNLRCLNIAYNKIQDIRMFVNSLKKCSKLKLLASFNNPISMLWLYWDYITQSVSLQHFDGKKYIKPEPEIQDQPQEQKPVQDKKDEKKDTKNAKKGGKGEQKPPEPQPIKQIKYKEPRIRTEDDYKLVNFKLQITNFEGFNGQVYDSSLFSQQNVDPKQTQTCFWIETKILQKQINLYDTRILMEQITVDNDVNRLDFQFKFESKLYSNIVDLQKLWRGTTIYIWKQQPIIKTDAQTGQQSVQMDEEQIKKRKTCIGGVYVNLRQLMPLRVKQMKKNKTVFVRQAVDSPLFKNPFENEQQLIKKNRIQFDAKIAEEEQQKRKKAEQEEAAKAQKKGGKDAKKGGADKKGAKKQGKQPQTDRKTVKVCQWQKDSKQYCYLQQGRMFKCLKDHYLAVSISLQ